MLSPTEDAQAVIEDAVEEAKLHTIVYTTKTGSNYHTKTCEEIRDSDAVYYMAFGDALAGDYTPCSKCGAANILE